jgi:protein-S-isoprenylcysteine O-methyltransferase Ste14
VSYFLITVGLAGVLHIEWILIPSLCIAFGIYPTAKTEEEVLIEQFGEEYVRYQQEVGMFLPKIWNQVFEIISEILGRESGFSLECFSH